MCICDLKLGEKAKIHEINGNDQSQQGLCAKQSPCLLFQFLPQALSLLFPDGNGITLSGKAS